MTSNLNLIAKFTASPFPGAPGHYAGLIADPNGLNPQSAGYLALTVRHSGAFSGKALVGGTRVGFMGEFNSAGDTLLYVRRRPGGTLTISLHVDIATGTDQVSGTVSDGAWVSTVSGNRNVFVSRFNPAPQAGLRLLTLQQAQNATAASADAMSRISSAGGVSIRGKLGNSQRFVTSSTLAKNGDCPFYVSFNRGNELMIGWLNFPAGTEPAADGTVFWLNAGTNAFARSLQVSSSSVSAR
jgi:hypothetical protein